MCWAWTYCCNKLQGSLLARWRQPPPPPPTAPYCRPGRGTHTKVTQTQAGSCFCCCFFFLNNRFPIIRNLRPSKKQHSTSTQEWVQSTDHAADGVAVKISDFSNPHRFLELTLKKLSWTRSRVTILLMKRKTPTAVTLKQQIYKKM